MYVRTYSRVCIELVILSWEISGATEIPRGRQRYTYLPQGRIIVIRIYYMLLFTNLKLIRNCTIRSNVWLYRRKNLIFIRVVLWGLLFYTVALLLSLRLPSGFEALRRTFHARLLRLDKDQTSQDQYENPSAFHQTIPLVSIVDKCPQVSLAISGRFVLS